MKRVLSEKQLAVLRKMSEINRHRVRNNKYTAESRLKMSLGRKGKKSPHTEETKRKISQSHFGIKPSDETRLKMSVSRKGKLLGNTNGFKKGVAINKGKKFSASWKENLSNSHKGIFPSVQTRIKMSNSQKKGRFNHSWKGGITPISFAIRNSLDNKLWRKSVFERDNFICQKTGISGGDLEVHHINNFADFPELRFDVSNGITLSKKAHRDFHNKYGYRNNTEDQMKDFLKNK